MSTLNDDLEYIQDKELGRHNERKYRDALKRIRGLEKELDGYKAVAVPPSQKKIKKRRHKKTESHATVIAMATDWHVEEIVKPSTVQYRNSYTPDIAKQRAHNFFRKLILLTNRERQDTIVNELCLILGGDFISGHIHDELKAGTAMQPVEAILFAQDLLSEGLRFIEKEFKSITVICKPGNHGRITKKQQYDANPQSLEYAMYSNLARQFPQFKWVIEDSYLTYFTIYDEVLRIHHGDGIRYQGGIGGLEVPMNRAIAQWNLSQRATINLMGHWHSYIPGYNTVAGSLIGWNAFAAKNRFQYQPPSQPFLLLNEKLGITCHAPLLVE